MKYIPVELELKMLPCSLHFRPRRGDWRLSQWRETFDRRVTAHRRSKLHRYHDRRGERTGNTILKSMPMGLLKSSDETVSQIKSKADPRTVWSDCVAWHLHGTRANFLCLRIPRKKTCRSRSLARMARAAVDWRSSAGRSAVAASNSISMDFASEMPTATGELLKNDWKTLAASAVQLHGAEANQVPRNHLSVFVTH